MDLGRGRRAAQHLGAELGLGLSWVSRWLGFQTWDLLARQSGVRVSDFVRMFAALCRVVLFYDFGSSCKLLFRLVHHDRRKGLRFRVGVAET